MRDLASSEEQGPAPGLAAIGGRDFLWVLGSLCALNRLPFSPALVQQQFPPPYRPDALVHAARALGLGVDCRTGSVELASVATPALVLRVTGGQIVPVLVVRCTGREVVVFEAGTDVPVTRPLDTFAAGLEPWLMLCGALPEPLTDPDLPRNAAARFGFQWFGAELLKHRRVWRDVLLASLVIQLLALGLPLFTQVVIDKVVVHRTESTLWVIAAGMSVFMVFSALLGWTRQYLILHTGNRVDAVLGSAVCQHLFKLPPRYFSNGRRA